jgi:hypothetical protein
LQPAATFSVLRCRDVSREAAQECSPRRKPVGKKQNENKPQRGERKVVERCDHWACCEAPLLQLLNNSIAVLF